MKDRNNNSTHIYAILQPFFQVLLGEPMLSQRRDLLEQPLDFYEPDVLPAAQPIVSKHYRKTQWFGCLLFCRHGICTPCLTNSVKALKQTEIIIAMKWNCVISDCWLYSGEPSSVVDGVCIEHAISSGRRVTGRVVWYTATSDASVWHRGTQSSLVGPASAQW